MTLREDLRDLKPYVAGKLLPGAVKLSSNENPLGPSPRALEAIAASARELNIYPDGAATALREALANAYGLKPGNFLVGNGSDEVFTLIAGAFIRPGDHGLTAKETFSEYTFAVRLFGGFMDTVPLKEGFFDLDGLVAAITPRTRIVFLCNPNNPTGTAFTQAQLEAFLTRVPASVLVVLDEAYGHYADAADFPDSFPLLARWPNLAVSRTFSKIYGLASLRIGFVAASESVIRDISVVKQPFNVGNMTQKAAIAALHDTDFVSQSRALNHDGLKFWTEKLATRSLKPYPTQANFFCLELGRDAQAVAAAMVQGGVTIRPLTSFGLPTAIRITTGTREQNELCWNALCQALDTVPRLG
ncbi:MAG: histidinol-phosphate transaminase [Spirochaetales bacterium]